MPGGSYLPTDPGAGSVPNPEEVLAGNSSPEVGEEVSQGETAGLFAKINSNTASMNVLARVLSGLFAIGEGLGVNPGSGLTATIDDGYAVIDGVVPVSGAQPYVLPASQADVWLWLKQDGTFTHTLTTTPPAGKSCLLAHLSTDGSSVLSCDPTVAYRLRSGMVWRETTDDGPPTDLPSDEHRTFRKTSAGTYVWDGEEWKEIAKADAFPVWRSFTVPFADLQTAGTSLAVVLRSVPAGSVVHAARLRVTEAFGGGSIAALSLDLGTPGSPSAYVSALDGMSLGSDVYAGVSFESDSGPTDIELLATSSGDDLSALDSGQAEIALLLSVGL